MNEDFTIAFIFAFHIALLAVKLWAFYYVVKAVAIMETPLSEKYMMVFKPFEMVLVIFCAVTAVAEIYFLVNFFIDMPLYYYEYISMADEIFFISMTIRYLKKEVS